jgi:DNA-binding Lrp family transcriptional regulator
MLTDLEKKVIASIQGDIAITERPYRRIADDLGISEQTLLDTLQDLCQRGVIRRFGATLKHQKSGYAANVMVAWQVDEERVPEVGKMLAAFRAVSHCYRRNPTDQWPYNLYTMVHGRDEAACRETASRMSQKVNVKTYILLFSRRELKKTSMRYFPTE